MRWTQTQVSELWSRKLDDHIFARATGSPTLYNGRLYVPLAGVGEEGQGGQPRYECCTFRGSVTALDANTGAVVWKSYTIPDAPAARGKNAEGKTIWGPSGGGVWGAPTIDPARRSIYITTGNNYSGPATMTSDAVIAMDIETGRHKWVFQPLANDVWAGGCGRSNPPGGQCPETLGPDHDFSISPSVVKTVGRKRSDDRAAEVGHGLRGRSRQGDEGVGIPHRRGCRARRPVGRGGGRSKCLLRRQRTGRVSAQ